MKKQIINSAYIIKCDTEDLPDNIIGVAVSVSDNIVNHAGIFIRYNSTNYFFHFNSQEVKLVEVPQGAICFFKRLDFIPDEMIPSTFSYFKIIEKTAKPAYGYFYSGSLYDSKTLNFIDENDMPEIMSCVGFCLNVLKTVLRQKDFMQYTDWHYHNGITEDDILRYFKKAVENFPHIDLEEFAKHVRRILPIEYFAAGYGKTQPVKKVFTDLHIREIGKSVLSKV